MDRNALPPSRRATLHRRGIRLEWITVVWNVVEALVAFGTDSLIELVSAGALLRRLRRAGPDASAEEHGAAEHPASDRRLEEAGRRADHQQRRHPM